MIVYITIILLLLYSSFYFIFNDEITIYQSDIEHFDFNMLYNKQPIVIADSLQDPMQIIKSWFNLNIIDTRVINSDIWIRNKYKYLIVYSDDAEITLCNPKHKMINKTPENTEQLITIKLKNKRLLIIPFKWYYNINGNVVLYGVHDFITKIFEYIS
jgi:hypothetical protein